MIRTFLKKLTFVILALVMVVSLTGCQEEQVKEPQASEDRELTILQGVDATTLDPNMHSETPTANIDRQIFDSLLDQNDDMEVVPSIATDWSMKNETTWEFTLRDDIYFHDGEKLTAQDVVYSLERILDSDNMSSQIGNLNDISNIVADDDFHLTIETYEPYPLLLVRLAALRVVPKHYVEKVGKAQFAKEPIGSGPYLLDKWVKDEQISLIANDNYWKGSPEIKKVVFKPVPESAARVMSVQAGEADIAVNLPPHQAIELENNENTKVGRANSTRFLMLVFTTKNKAVSDPKVRKAINMAIDVESIVDNIFLGNASITAQPVCNFDLGYQKDLENYGYDVEQAQSLLKESNFANGMSIKMGSPSGRYSMDKEVVEAIASQLNDAGFNVDLTFEEWGSYANKTLAGTQDYDLWLIGWGSSTFDAGSTLDFWLNSDLVTSYYEDENYNDTLDGLLNKSKKTMDDEERAELYRQVIQIAHDQAAFAPLYQQLDLYGMSQRVNWDPRPDESIRVFNMSWRE